MSDKKQACVTSTAQKSTLPYLLEITVFLTGAIVMIFELAWSRILWPYFGTSIFVWTSLIGIILGSLSIGYYLGGYLADRSASYTSLSKYILYAAFAIAFTALSKDIVIIWIESFGMSEKLSMLVATSILFIPASILLGIDSPYAVKLKLENMNSSWATVGKLYALGTLGSIIGTFFTGFVLIPTLGTNKILILLVISLVLLSILLSYKKHIILKILSLLLAIVWFITLDQFQILKKLVPNAEAFIDIDTMYNRIWIYNHTDSRTGQKARVMGINNENHSSMFVESDELVNDYTRVYHLARHFAPEFQKTMMLWGAGYSFPKDFLRTYTWGQTIDVIEIDPKVTELAKQYFRLEEDPRLRIIHTDGRVYLNTTKEKYDVIFGDAFSSHYSVPYQLTTQEAVQRQYDVLTSSGVAIINLISAIEWDKGKFLRAEYHTFASVFPQVYIFQVRDADSTGIQNLMLVALKSKNPPSFTSDDPVIQSFLDRLWKGEIAKDIPLLTDDFAPVDQYILEALGY
jgi:spermidine synthase